MSSFGLGYKAIKSLVESQNALLWNQTKLSAELFKPGEVELYQWVAAFLGKYHELPKAETVAAQFPDFKNYPTPEPPAYYVDHLQNRLFYDLINNTNISSQQILKANATDVDKAAELMATCLAKIREQKYRTKLVNVKLEGPKMVLQAYHNVYLAENVGEFGWEYLDKSSGGMMPGDVVTFIGRPAAGKTWMVLWTAIHNWRKRKKRVLVVSMEMAPLPIIQRVAAMYTHSNISQLKLGGFATQTYKKFASSLLQMAQEDQDLYVVDGNLAASVEDVYTLAAQLKIDQVYIDGAYLMRHPNKRLDRYTRVAENAELIKQTTTSVGCPTIASYQFARSAVKDKKDKTAGLEDIGSSDVIGQVSSISLGLFQDDSVETIEGRDIRVLKGRNGEIGQFSIKWDFDTMDFDQKSQTMAEATAELEYI